jgi:hypothetical protein
MKVEGGRIRRHFRCFELVLNLFLGNIEDENMEKGIGWSGISFFANRILR